MATMMAQAERQIARIDALDQQIAQKVAEADRIAAAIDNVEAGLPFLVDTADTVGKSEGTVKT